MASCAASASYARKITSNSCITALVYGVLLFLPLISATYDGKSFDGDLLNRVGGFACTRLFSSGQAVGCRSPDKGGSKGVLYSVRNDADLAKSGDLKVDFVAVMSMAMMNATTLDTLRSRGMKGVLVLPDENGNAYYEQGKYSPDVASPHGDATPEGQLTLNNTYTWNLKANGLLMRDLAFPVVRLAQEDVDRVHDWCKENRQTGFDNWPLYVAEMDYYMGPSSVTSKKCLDWKDRDGTRDPQCLPLGGQSVWATDGTLDARPKVLATTGMDTTSIFHDLSTGANDAVSVIATLLAAADAISQVDTSSLPQQIAFLLAQADEWGYAGTRRFVQDLDSFQCSNAVDSSVSHPGLPQCLDPVYPTTLFASLGTENITAVIGVDQVGVVNRGGTDEDSPYKLFVHGLEGSQATVGDVLAASTGADNAQVVKSSQFALPPVGAGVFAQARPELPVAVLAGYDAAFIDPRYHSEGDTTISVDAVTAAANVLARSLYKLAGGASADDVPPVNSTLVSALVGCLTSSWDCDFMSSYYRSEQANLANYLDTSWISLRGSTTPPNYFVGVIYATQNGLPVVQHASSVYTRYSGTFSPSTDVVYMIPSKLEAFVRSYLMFTLGSDRNSTAGCATSADCGVCSILHYDQVRMECQQGQCICPNSFYHLAMDPGIEPRSTPNTFKIVDESAPSYTEPYWSNLRTRVYLDAGSGIGYVMFSIGMIVLVGSIVCSWMFVQSLEKKKVL